MERIGVPSAPAEADPAIRQVVDLIVGDEGVLRVTDLEKFRNALLHGIGSAKAFGFGLLVIAPISGS